MSSVEELILFWLSTLKVLSDLIAGPPYVSTIVAIAGRLAYVGYIWVMLSRQLKQQRLSKDSNQTAYRKFKRGVVAVMNLDAFFFILATVENSNEIVRQQPLFVGSGLVFLLVGVSIKAAAIKALGSKGYYWYDFFFSEGHALLVRKGIYRYMKHPMYDGGYLHTYGFAFICLSWTGLVLAGFMQLTMKLFWYFVERRNFMWVYGKRE